MFLILAWTIWIFDPNTEPEISNLCARSESKTATIGQIMGSTSIYIDLVHAMLEFGSIDLKYILLTLP